MAVWQQQQHHQASQSRHAQAQRGFRRGSRRLHHAVGQEAEDGAMQAQQDFSETNEGVKFDDFDGRPAGLRSVPTPARSQRSDQQGAAETSSWLNSSAQSAPTGSYREYLQARGQEAMRRGALPRGSAQQSPGQQQHKAMPSAPPSPPPPPPPPLGQPWATSPHHGDMCWYGHGASDLSPTSLPPQTNPHGPVVLSTSQQTMVSPDLVSLGNCGHDYGQMMCIGTQPPPMMQGTTPMGGDAGHREAVFFNPPQVPMLPGACSPTAVQAALMSPPSTPPPIEVARQSPTPPDLSGLMLPTGTGGTIGAPEAGLMATLMPEATHMNKEELAAQLMAAAQCCYED